MQSQLLSHVLRVLSLGATMVLSCSGNESEQMPLSCNFDGKFLGEVSVRSQQDNTNLCEAPAEIRTNESGYLEFVKRGPKDQVLVWLQSETDSEVWRLNFGTQSCELALPFPPGCPDDKIQDASSD